MLQAEYVGCVVRTVVVKVGVHPAGMNSKRFLVQHFLQTLREVQNAFAVCLGALREHDDRSFDSKRIVDLFDRPMQPLSLNGQFDSDRSLDELEAANHSKPHLIISNDIDCHKHGLDHKHKVANVNQGSFIRQNDRHSVIN
jgi:hypothetical protein